MNDENKNTTPGFDPFLSSVESVTKDDIESSGPPEKKKISLYSVIRIGLIAVFLTVFAVSIGILADRVSDYGESEKLYDHMADLWNSDDFDFENPFGEVAYSDKDIYASGTPDFESAQTLEGSTGNGNFPTNADSPEMVAIKTKLNALKMQNRDLVCWITIDNTVINYPVVLGDDNTYYLTHSFDHTYSLSGTLFMDYRNTGDLDENYNTIIYGHNLAIGTMFSDLDKYFKKSFFNANKYVRVYTEKGTYIYEIFNVAKVNISLNYIRTSFRTPNEFIEFAYAMKANSLYSTDTQFNANDRILTLSTCTNAGTATERYCVQAKLVEVRR